MSRHTELIEAVYATFDFKLAASGRLDSLWAQHMQADFTAYPPDIYPDLGSYRGLERFKDFCRTLTDAWDEWSFEAGQMEEGRDAVVVHVRLAAKGRGSGVAVNEQAWHLWTFRDGRAASIRTYLEHAPAREAAGLGDLQSRR